MNHDPKHTDTLEVREPAKSSALKNVPIRTALKAGADDKDNDPWGGRAPYYGSRAGYVR